MKEIKLSQGMVALVDDEDYEWLNKWKWSVSASKGTLYVERKLKPGKKIKMHRLILGLTDSKLLGDHKDSNGLNNQRSNLRVATKSQNRANSRKFKGVSKYLGVSWHSTNKKWVAQIRSNNIHTVLGYFESEKDAAIAYNEAAIKIHGEFARINIF